MRWKKSGKISLKKHIAIGANMFHNNSYMFVSRNFALVCQRIFLQGCYFFHKLPSENGTGTYCIIMFTGAIKMHKTVHHCVRHIPRIPLVPHMYRFSW